MENGYLQVYTGDGKGKTTAALGVALRAIGAGYRVYLGQFMKQGNYSEIKALHSLGGDNLTIQQYGDGGELSHIDEDCYRQAATDGFAKAQVALLQGGYDLVILDELNVVLSLGYLPLDEVMAMINSRPAQTELIVTGRGAPAPLVEAADLVTEMREIKHYYQKGVPARIGIEK